MQQLMSKESIILMLEWATEVEVILSEQMMELFTILNDEIVKPRYNTYLKWSINDLKEAAWGLGLSFADFDDSQLADLMEKEFADIAPVTPTIDLLERIARDHFKVN